MKQCTICLYLSNNKNEYYTNYIKELFKDHNININFLYNEDYKKYKCNLLIYDVDIFNHDFSANNFNDVKDRTFFTSSKYNKTLFLCLQFNEGHSYPFYQQEILYSNTFYKCLYPESGRSYSISHFDNSMHNYQRLYSIYDNYNLNNYLNNGAKNHKIIKEKFCAQVTSHETFIREIFNNAISGYKQIDNYGNAYRIDNDSKFYSDDELLNILPKYKFMLCCENNFSFDNEAYITEKIYKSFLYGCVPIYWGNNKQIYNIFNKDSFINLTDLTCHDALELIIKYDNDDTLYYNMLHTYPFKKGLNIDKYVNDILNGMNNFIIYIVYLSMK